MLRIGIKSIGQWKNRERLGGVLLSVIVFILCMIAVNRPLFGVGSTYTADDVWYHLLRIENVRAGLEAGQFPVRMGTNWLNHYGYASSLCYPEAFLYFPAALQLLFGMSATRSFKLFIILLNVLTYGALYYCGKGVAKSRNAGTMAAVIVMLSPYHLANIYLRGAIGEVQAFLFFPFIVYGLYNLIYEEFDRPWLLGIGFWGLMLSHAISLVFALCVTFVMVLLHFRNVVLDRKKFLRLLLTGAIVLLSTIGYWLPFLEQLASNTFNFSTPWTFVSDQALTLSRLLSLESDRYNFGIVIILMCVSCLFVRKREASQGERRTINWLLISGVILLYCTTRYFPWKLVQPLLNSVQFPWRLYAIASTFIAMGIAMTVTVKWKGRTQQLLTAGMLAVMLCVGGYYLKVHPVSYAVVEKNAYENSANTFNIVQEEWLPVDVEIAYMTGERQVLDDKGNELSFETLDNGDLEILLSGGEQYVECPLLWYKGYHAYLLLEDGNSTELAVTGEGFNGKVRVYLEDAEGGERVLVSYDGTAIQHVTWVISVVCTAAGAGYFIWVETRRGKFLQRN